MRAKYLWKSRIAGYLTNFIDTMQLAGYKFEAQERHLRQFDQYCFDHNVPDAALPKEAVEDFCYGDEYQSQSTRQSRLCVLRKLAVFMGKSGCRVFVPPMQKTPHRPRYQPYIYTEKELRDFFTQIDTWDRAARSDKRWAVDSLLFRMLYGCGLRLTEALKLMVADVDLEAGILRIRQSKNNRDRLVPMSGSLAERCREYSRIMHTFSSPDSYYFPGLHGECYDKSTIYRRFREYLWKAGISHSGKGPRIHDLRHAYCVHRLKKWVLDRKDLTNFLPYLVAYLGHADFRGTEYYLRLTADLYPEIVSRLELAFGYVIPGEGAAE